MLNAPRKPVKINHYSFDEINSEASYWIGFLLTDGCVTDDHRIIVQLSSKDVKQLEKFRSFLGSEHRITTALTSSGSGQVTQSNRINVSSKKMCEKLKEFGVVPRKTKTTKCPESMKNNIDFWRGCIDGDGWVSLVKFREKEIPIVGLCGTMDMVSNFREFVKQYVPEIKANIRPQGSIFCINFARGPAQKLASLLYKDSSVFLDRKYQTATRIASWIAVGRGRKGIPRKKFCRITNIG